MEKDDGFYWLPNEIDLRKIQLRSPLPEDKLDRLLVALRPLAGLISAGSIPDPSALENILVSVGVEKEAWALQELELWREILGQAYGTSDNTKKGAIVAELRQRGIPEFPAILAVDKASLSVEPQNIDFGALCAGEKASVTLKVSGGYVKEVIVRNDRNARLKVTSHNPRGGGTLINVAVSGGQAGESLQAHIVLKGAREGLTIPVTARWGRVKLCPHCGKKSRFWNSSAKIYECMNGKCPGP